MRRVGVIIPQSSNDVEETARIAAVEQGMQQAGWKAGDNLQIDVRWGGDHRDLVPKCLGEWGRGTPDVSLVPGSAIMGPLLQATRGVPILFVVVPDPVCAGVVDSL